MEGGQEVTERFPADDLRSWGHSEEVYLRYLESLREVSGRWDRGKGWISWLQGRALNRLRESIQHKVCDRGAYGRVLRQLGMKQTTAWYCRRIAGTFTADAASTLGFSEMLYRIGARKKPAMKAKAARRGFLRKCESFHKYIEGIELSRECAHFAPAHRASAVGHLKAIARAAGIAAVELEEADERAKLRIVKEDVTKEAI
jgi:hypothetical protein